MGYIGFAIAFVGILILAIVVIRIADIREERKKNYRVKWEEKNDD